MLWNDFSKGLITRQREVAAMVVQGLSNRRIAQGLFLSERAVENHVSKILGKLRLTSRAQVASWENEQQLLAPEPDQVLGSPSSKRCAPGRLIRRPLER